MCIIGAQRSRLGLRPQPVCPVKVMPSASRNRADSQVRSDMMNETGQDLSRLTEVGAQWQGPGKLAVLIPPPGGQRFACCDD